ncbi:preprotein translocase subunit SecE [Natronospora cellulosivora (SeqCode)]
MAELGFFGKIAKFFRQVKAEMKKSNWPSREEVKSNTAVVVVTILVLIVAIGIFDQVLSNLITPLIM